MILDPIFYVSSVFERFGYGHSSTLGAVLRHETDASVLLEGMRGLSMETSASAGTEARAPIVARDRLGCAAIRFCVWRRQNPAPMEKADVQLDVRLIVSALPVFQKFVVVKRQWPTICNGR